MEFNLTGYLKKFEGILPHETKVRNAVIAAVREELGVTLERSKIAVSRDVVSIVASAALRSEIAIKRVKIMARIRELQPDVHVSRIQ